MVRNVLSVSNHLNVETWISEQGAHGPRSNSAEPRQSLSKTDKLENLFLSSVSRISSGQVGAELISGYFCIDVERSTRKTARRWKKNVVVRTDTG